MAGLVFLLVSWVLAGACQRHGGVDGFLLYNFSSAFFFPCSSPLSFSFFPFFVWNEHQRAQRKEYFRGGACPSVGWLVLGRGVTENAVSVVVISRGGNAMGSQS
jgi:hypothetical protein